MTVTINRIFSIIRSSSQKPNFTDYFNYNTFRFWDDNDIYCYGNLFIEYCIFNHGFIDASIISILADNFDNCDKS
jgi:hypothetical protein